MNRETESSNGGSFFRELECGEKTIQLKQLYVGDVGCVVWDAAIVLAKFLENKTFFPAASGPGTSDQCSHWRGKRVVDLGSGTGVVGIVAGVLGADVTVTDLPEFVDLMSDNVSINKDVITGSLTAQVLKWGEDVSRFLPSPEYVLMADVVYYEESLPVLLKTLVDLCSRHTTVLMSYEERTTGNKPLIEKRFFEMMDKHFTKTEVLYESLDNVFRSRDIHVIMFTLPVERPRQVFN